MKNNIVHLCFILPLTYAICPVTVCAQPDSVKVNIYFETISKDENRLRQFFAEMPKGGDLHNHLTGAAYAESYFKFAMEDSLWVDIATGKLYQPKDSTKGKEMLLLSWRSNMCWLPCVMVLAITKSNRLCAVVSVSGLCLKRKNKYC